MKKNFLLAVILLSIVASCKKHVGSLIIPHNARKIGLVSPTVNIQISEFIPRKGVGSLGPKKYVRSTPIDMLIDEEKALLDSLITDVINIVETELQFKLINIPSQKLKNDFRRILDIDDSTEIISQGLLTKKKVKIKINENEEGNYVNYQILDKKIGELKPDINIKTGKYKVVLQKADFKIKKAVDDNPETTLIDFDKDNFIYSRNGQSGYKYLSKKDIVNLCMKNGLAALMTIEMRYQFERTADFFSVNYKWRIRLAATINIYDNKGFLFNQNFVTGRSKYDYISQYDLSKYPQIQFIVDENSILQNKDKIEIFEIYPRSKFSFSLQNMFAPLYRQANKDLLKRMSVFQ